MARLVWNPVRPLTGAADWLERLRLAEVPGAAGRCKGLARHFDKSGAIQATPGTPTERHALVEPSGKLRAPAR